MPVIAGIFIIVSEGFKLFALLGLSIISFFIVIPLFIIPVDTLTIVLFGILPAVVLTAVAVAGGIFALRRKRWGLALAGAIIATLPFSVFGLAAIILLILSRDEFE